MVARIRAPEHVYPGIEFSARLELESSVPGPVLGSYALHLTWDPARCEYAGDEPGIGSTSLSSPLVDRREAASGRLAWNAADPLGATGPVELLRVTFRPVGPPGTICALATAPDSLYAALTYEDLMPIAVAGNAAAEIRGPEESLSAAVSPAGTSFRWSVFPGATSYDAVRGSLAAIGAGTIGPLDCVEADSPDTTTAGGHEDASVPAASEAFFYLLQVDDEGYGTDSSGLPRSPSSGGCP